MSQIYQEYDAAPRSPGLEPFNPKCEPWTQPLPEITTTIVISSNDNVSSPSSRKRRGRSNRRRKTQASLSDTVLLRYLGPNNPEVAQIASEDPLDDNSGPESEDESDESDGEAMLESSTTLPATLEPSAHARSTHEVSALQATAQKALEDSNGFAQSVPTKDATSNHRDSVVSIDAGSLRSLPPLDASAAPGLTNGALPGLDKPVPGRNSISALAENSLPLPTRERNGSIANNFARGQSPGASPHLRKLSIPSSRALPSHTLPALQPPHSPLQDSANSPNRERRLPSIKHINDIADTVISERQEQGRSNSLAHRQSVSSSNQSPTTRHLSISSLSPAATLPPLNATSPISAASETTSKDLFLRTGGSQTGLFSPRRPSQASDLQSNHEYQSSDGLSPSSQPTPIETRVHRMSIDSTLTTRQLPPFGGPIIQHVPPHGTSGYKCDYPGCTAQSFQTQYLLNSHANVHSQSRPHYCPVQGCLRAEGGKGFKRKNEMIRHGLVHASPGYVCPFCPDREHKYPRPDNLQRHVRVHHVDKHKDDELLREVLSQRPEGGPRGRRRRRCPVLSQKLLPSHNQQPLVALGIFNGVIGHTIRRPVYPGGTTLVFDPVYVLTGVDQPNGIANETEFWLPFVYVLFFTSPHGAFITNLGFILHMSHYFRTPTVTTLLRFGLRFSLRCTRALGCYQGGTHTLSYFMLHLDAVELLFRFLSFLYCSTA
ncbi:hypothetical protein BU24DRAFT_404888 [Aaosphaeria arxii CBS 175.79]|uniref:C2H2-type domain-containing protein n=1 Tax=Aaosphaeria arxii CBS 175.79 TaxID=1450172 RepID=A0A6A5YAB2_9PLEO|nr:uncharacterized protein BU24DRAFT_404888 [Aaosphaeria arxii CBS 175.79]KAF2021957.1 hypothetical protein BU24DRAFT_404888 [Aaosphaeria arxii CBS 175.79]